MIIAKDIMTHSPNHVLTSDTVQQAINIFTQNKLSTLPVLSTVGKVEGVISEISLLKAYIKIRSAKRFDDKIVDHREIIEPPITVNEKADIAMVVQAALRSPYHRVLVLDDMDHLLGVISPKDILLVLNENSDPSLTMQKELRELRQKAEKIQDLNQELKKTEAQMKTYENLFDSSNFMLHSLDKDGKIIMANPRIHEVLGYAPGELVGKTIKDLYPQHLWDEVEKGLKKIESQGTVETVYSAYRKKNGEVVKVEVASQAVKDEKGKFVATSTISRLIDPEALLRLLHGVFK